MLDRFAVGSWTVRLRSLRDHSLRSLRDQRVSQALCAGLSARGAVSLLSAVRRSIINVFLTQNELPYRATRYML